MLLTVKLKESGIRIRFSAKCKDLDPQHSPMDTVLYNDEGSKRYRTGTAVQVFLILNGLRDWEGGVAKAVYSVVTRQENFPDITARERGKQMTRQEF